MRNPASRNDVRRLILEYAFRLDAGDFEGVAELFRAGTWNGHVGRSATLKWLIDHVVLYDGAPRTQHVVTNVQIDVGPTSNCATARSYISLFHAMPDSEPTLLTSNLYEDVFQRQDGEWAFLVRTITPRVRGDMSGHLRFDVP